MKMKPGKSMPLGYKALKTMITMVQNTKSQELTCGECFEELDKFAEMKLYGKSAIEMMDLVEDHLKSCGDCKEEFTLLLKALKTIH